ncbi:MAG: glycosyltransferase family 9 protein [Elusimicrobiales bacterium]|nr:glycosyltransferase family 9 protein [Elusimicrobiales bacterium]
MNNILIIWIGRLGDFAVSLRFLNAVRKTYPESKITFIGTKKNRELAEISSLFDSIIFLPNIINFFVYLKVIISLYFKKYDLLIDLNPSYSRTSNLIANITHSKRKVSFTKKLSEKIFTDTITLNETIPTREKYRQLARYLNLDYDVIYILKIDLHNYGQELLIKRKIDINKKLIAIFAGNFNKVGHKWPDEKFIELTKKLRTKYTDFEFFYIASIQELKANIDGIISKLPLQKFVISSSIKDLISILENTNLLITNNTGILHIADILDIPTLSINTKYSHTIWLPEGEKHTSVYSQNWKSCHDISADEVIKKFSELF